MSEEPAVKRPPGKFAPVAVIALTAIVFGAGLAFVTWQLRIQLREQVLLREGDSLGAVTAMQLANSATEMAELGIAEAPGDILAAVLKTSRLRGVLAIRVIDEKQQSAFALPWVWTEAAPDAKDWIQLTQFRPITRLRARADRTELAGVVSIPKQSEEAVPLLEIWVPLRRTESASFAGAAQFWIDGAGIAAEFARIDRSLGLQAGLAWAAGTALITFALGSVFRRLEQAQRSLQEHSRHLEKANRELALAAKTSALGAVSAHLIHELKNPIAGLESLVALSNEKAAEDGGRNDLSAAAEIAARLRGTVNEVVSLLRDEEQGSYFDLSGTEIAEVAVSKIAGLGGAKNVVVENRATVEKAIAGRRANLAVLVLQNLLKNAIEASEAGRRVTLTATVTTEGNLEYVVEDQGGGLPDSVRERLFQPCRSTKAGGTGIGLALCQQLAQRADGYIDLISSDKQGTRFRLVLKPEV